MRIRIRFQKHSSMKFIGHLDMLRYFQKSMRRAEIDIAYSEGFSPHQIMSFASPLGVGITSDGEYIDIEVHSSKSSRESINDLNRVMVDGMKITSYKQLQDQDEKAMAAVTAASYRITIKDGYCSPDQDSIQKMQDFYEKSQEILVQKKTKKSEKTMDLKELIYEFRIDKEAERPVFYMLLSSGSLDNLKPELVLETLYQQAGLEYLPLSFQIHRLDVFTNDKKELVSLGEAGIELD